jgi:hypothetical protein
LETDRPDWELDLLRALYRKRVAIKEKYHRGDDPDLVWEVSIGSRWRGPYFMSRGETRAEARWKVIESVALNRLMEHFQHLGWTDVDDYIEQGVEFVMARDPNGVMWGVAPYGDDPDSRRDLLERIEREEVTDRAAAIDYRDILDPARIQMTLDAAEPWDHRPQSCR